MELVDEYGARGWEIERLLKWGDGDNVEIDMLNLEKGVLAEVKSEGAQFSDGERQRRRWAERSERTGAVSEPE